jgi:phage terminase large subunit-like protein
MWDLSCPDWEDRLRTGRSLIPDDLPLNKTEADLGAAFFDELPLPDGLDEIKLRDAAGRWFHDIVRVIFGSWFPERRVREIRDIFALAPKGSSKTTYSAGLMLAIMLMNKRRNAEALFIGPTQSISDRAFDQAAAMIKKSPDLQRRFDPQDYHKVIVDKVNRSEMKVKTFNLDILTGSFPIFVLLDELHLLGRNSHTTKVLRQIRGGLDKREEGALLITTTQSDDIPAGAFKDELKLARQIRDGKLKGKTIRPMLPLLYELPTDIALDQAKWGDPQFWPMVMPNLGRPVGLPTLVADWESEKLKGEHAVRVWASQHLNIEIGIGLKSDSWSGADHWLTAVDETLTLDTLLERSEVVLVGADGGGLDDLFGLAVLGRERGTKRWLLWSHAWCHRIVLQKRQTIAARLEGFAADGELTIVEHARDDLDQIVAIIARINDAGLLGAVAIDNEGPFGELVDELDLIGVNDASEQLVGIGQGWRLMRAIKTTERKLENGSLVHAPSGMMNWCVGNVRIEATRSAILATKQNAGDAKVDPVFALWDAADVMIRNPQPKGSSAYSKDRGLFIVDLV